MLRKIITGFALLLLTVIAVTQSIDVYNTHLSNETEQFVVVNLGLYVDPGDSIFYEIAGRDHGNTSGFQCASHGLGSAPSASACGYVSYLDSIGQVTTIYVDKSGSCFQESVIAELLPKSCRS